MSHLEEAERIARGVSARKQAEIQGGYINALLAINDTLQAILTELMRTGPKTTPFLFEPPKPE